jgi:hypothetical protein
MYVEIVQAWRSAKTTYWEKRPSYTLIINPYNTYKLKQYAINETLQVVGILATFPHID